MNELVTILLVVLAVEGIKSIVHIWRPGILKGRFALLIFAVVLVLVRLADWTRPIPPGHSMSQAEFEMFQRACTISLVTHWLLACLGAVGLRECWGQLKDAIRSRK